jgi:hypothetical protein
VVVKILKKVLVISLFVWTNYSLLLFAQDNPQKATFNLDYTTEVQTNFGKKYNWVNLLSVSVGLQSEKISQRWTNGYLYAEFISVYKIFNKRIAGDLMTFSNIEEDNLPVNPFVLGYSHRWGKVSLFGGLRNVNNDYYITP